VDECEEKLESNANTKKDILNNIMEQLNFTKAYVQKLVKDENIRMPSLRRENAIIKKAHDSHAGLS